jgi:DNA polymerase-1
MPKEQEWRDLFVAPDGYKIVTADYSQIELRILAEISRDKVFIDAFKSGQDLHARTAAEVFNVPVDRVSKDQRNVAKTINFGLIYGMSASGLSSRLDITVEEAERFITAYFRAYPQIKDTLQQLGMKAVKSGYSETILGRKRYFKKAESFGAEKSLERKGRNTPIQSCCGDILKKAIFYLKDSLAPFDARIVNLVHDEVVLECRDNNLLNEAVRVVREDMIKAGRDFIKSVPIEVDIVIDKVWRK